MKNFGIETQNSEPETTNAPRSYPAVGKSAKRRQGQGKVYGWRTSIAVLFLLVTCHLSLVTGYGQNAQIKIVASLPASCTPLGTNSPVLLWKRSGTNIGLYQCTAVDTWTRYTTTPTSGTITANGVAYWVTSSALGGTAALTNGQVVIGRTGLAPAPATLTGTANETLITNASGSITIGLAAAVIHQGGANFILTDTADTAKRFQFIASGITTANTRSITVPDSNITLANTAAGQTFTGSQTFGSPILGPAGTGALPSYSFSGDPNTGMFNSGADAIGFATGGTERWIINSSGAFNPLVNNTYDIGNGTVNPRDVNIGRNLVLFGATSGSITHKAVAIAGSNTITWPAGTTDFSATGGTSQVLQQSSAGAAITVGQLAFSNISGSPTAVQLSPVAESLLGTTAAVDMNSAAEQTLYTCPAGRTCVITRVAVRNASTSLTTASYSFGWEITTATNVINNATHTELTGATLYTVLPAKAGSTVGAAAGTFKVLMNTLQGGAATTTMDVFGYVF